MNPARNITFKFTIPFLILLLAFACSSEEKVTPDPVDNRSTSVDFIELSLGTYSGSWETIGAWEGEVQNNPIEDFQVFTNETGQVILKFDGEVNINTSLIQFTPNGYFFDVFTANSSAVFRGFNIPYTISGISTHEFNLVKYHGFFDANTNQLALDLSYDWGTEAFEDFEASIVLTKD